MTEISTRTGIDPLLGEILEPETTLTLRQVEQLLNAAAAVERAKRPIVIHQAAPAPVAVPLASTSPVHEGIDVRVPAVTALRHRPCLHRVSGPLGRVSLVVALLGAGDMAWTAGSTIGAAAMAAGLLGAAAGAGLGVHEENRESRA